MPTVYTQEGEKLHFYSCKQIEQHKYVRVMVPQHERNPLCCTVEFFAGKWPNLVGTTQDHMHTYTRTQQCRQQTEEASQTIHITASHISPDHLITTLTTAAITLLSCITAQFLGLVERAWPLQLSHSLARVGTENKCRYLFVSFHVPFLDALDKALGEKVVVHFASTLSLASLVEHASFTPAIRLALGQRLRVALWQLVCCLSQ